ncbi:MAG: response regulator [Opitutaceae bacterium]|nr:response regulator [Opitutaceae bacterium]
MPHTILIIDDNDAFRGMLRTVLDARGYRVVVARTGADGLQVAAQQPIDAALVDVEMSPMDGFEFCQQFQEQSKAAGRDVPMWIMTGVLRPGLTKRAAAVGALVVLRKPLNIEATCAQFEREFRQRTERAESAAEADSGPPSA